MTVQQTTQNNIEANAFKRGRSSATRKANMERKIAVDEAFNEGLCTGISIGMNKPDEAQTILEILAKIRCIK